MLVVKLIGLAWLIGHAILTGSIGYYFARRRFKTLCIIISFFILELSVNAYVVKTHNMALLDLILLKLNILTPQQIQDFWSR